MQSEIIEEEHKHEGSLRLRRASHQISECCCEQTSQTETTVQMSAPTKHYFYKSKEKGNRSLYFVASGTMTEAGSTD